MYPKITIINSPLWMAIFWVLSLLLGGVSVAQEGALATDLNGVQYELDKLLHSFQCDLLDMAMDTASMIPMNPHSKDRSRSQKSVIDVCLQLDQPQRALTYLLRIDDWRRGLCYADLAFYCAQHGFLENIPHYLQLAEQISDTAEDWRRDRIRVRIAQTHAFLRHDEQVELYERNVVDSERGKVAGVKAHVSEENSFDDQMKEINGLIALENYDIVKNALDSCVELFNRFYDDQEKRSVSENKIKASWGKLPIAIRVELMVKMAGLALDHDDRNNALELINDGQGFMDHYPLPLEYRLTSMARLVVLRFRAGDPQKARTDLDNLRALFDTEGKKIVNIYRAGALRPLAEAYRSLGDTKTALLIYKQALETGVENLNSRPRAEDLSATCSSMALYDAEPDTLLWERIHQIYKGLNHPW